MMDPGSKPDGSSKADGESYFLGERILIFLLCWLRRGLADGTFRDGI